MQKRVATSQNVKNTTLYYAMGVQDTRNAGPEAAKGDICLELSLLGNKGILQVQTNPGNPLQQMLFMWTKEAIRVSRKPIQSQGQDPAP